MNELDPAWVAAATDTLLVGKWVTADSRSDLEQAVAAVLSAVLPLIRESLARKLEDHPEAHESRGNWAGGIRHAARIVRGQA